MADSWSDLEVYTLSECITSRRISTSIANLCLLLNAVPTESFVLVPRVNHHFVNLTKIYSSVGAASSLIQIFNIHDEYDDNGVSIVPDKSVSLINEKILSSMVVCFFKLDDLAASEPLHHCVTQKKAVLKSKFLFLCT